MTGYAVRGREEACTASQWVQSTLHRAGLVVNESKSSWQPAHEVQWLGFVVNLEQGCISVPVNKGGYRNNKKGGLKGGSGIFFEYSTLVYIQFSHL